MRTNFNTGDVKSITVHVSENPRAAVGFSDSDSKIKGVLVRRDSRYDIPYEMKASGVYLLLYPISADGTWSAYVGKSVNVRRRILEHCEPTWDRAMLVVSDREDVFTSTHIGWLEGRIYETLCASDLAAHRNRVTPGDNTLPAREHDALEQCVDGVRRVLRLFGYETATRSEMDEVAYTATQWYVDRANGTREWYDTNGQRHREDGPAIEHADGTKVWYRNGEFHREDGPAIDYADGTKVWYRNGEFHRDDGPAMEFADGSKHWYQNGECHREDGPAIERAAGKRGPNVWYWHDEEVSENAYAEFAKSHKVLDKDLGPLPR